MTPLSQVPCCDISVFVADSAEVGRDRRNGKPAVQNVLWCDPFGVSDDTSVAPLLRRLLLEITPWSMAACHGTGRGQSGPPSWVPGGPAAWTEGGVDRYLEKAFLPLGLDLPSLFPPESPK